MFSWVTKVTSLCLPPTLSFLLCHTIEFAEKLNQKCSVELFYWANAWQMIHPPLDGCGFTGLITSEWSMKELQWNQHQSLEDPVSFSVYWEGWWSIKSSNFPLDLLELYLLLHSPLETAKQPVGAEEEKKISVQWYSRDTEPHFPVRQICKCLINCKCSGGHWLFSSGTNWGLR